jgi:hypothetical protein
MALPLRRSVLVVDDYVPFCEMRRLPRTAGTDWSAADLGARRVAAGGRRGARRSTPGPAGAEVADGSCARARRPVRAHVGLRRRISPGRKVGQASAACAEAVAMEDCWTDRPPSRVRLGETRLNDRARGSPARAERRSTRPVPRRGRGQPPTVRRPHRWRKPLDSSTNLGNCPASKEWFPAPG